MCGAQRRDDEMRTSERIEFAALVSATMLRVCRGSTSCYGEKFTMTPRAVEWKTAFDHWQKTDYDDDQDPVITSSKYSSPLDPSFSFLLLAFREEFHLLWVRLLKY